MQLTVVLGSVTPPGRFSGALHTVLDAARVTDPSVQAELLNLAEYRIAFADGRPPQQLGDDTERLVANVQAADAVLLASPVYRASFTGALKNFLDHLPVSALAGKPCGIVAMGATQHHYLGAESHLRDVLAWFGALVAPTAVYLTSSDFGPEGVSGSARAELETLISTLARLSRVIGAAAPLGPLPLAARDRS
jgi:FMN reductase